MSAEPQLAAEVLPDSPYQGLEPFRESDRAYFFGREVDKERIGANLVTAPLTIFYGASGVGKTSVLLAGVLPFVHSQPDIAAIVFRSWQGEDFESALKAEIAAAVLARSGKTLNVDQTLDRCLDEAARLTEGTLAVVFDQFEEYMLYHAPKSPAGRSFDTAFARTVNRTGVDVNFLIGIREDALARLDRFRQYIPDLLSNRQQLVHLDEHGAEEAIRGPLQHYNAVARAKNQPELTMEIEDSLVRELIGQVRIGGGVGFGGTGRIDDGTVVRVETPFLQMVLQKLWDAERKAKSQVMRKKTLHDLGDAKKIVQDHVEGVMRALTDAHRAAASSIFDRLVTPSRSKIAYTLADLVQFAGDHGDAVEPLVKHLADPHVRILRAVASGEGQTVRYEIFHDVLSEAVLAWRAKHLRDMREAEKKRARVGCTIMAVAVVAIVLGIAWYLHREEEARQAAENRARAERQAAENRALAAQAKLLQVMTERANSMGSAGSALGDMTLLNVALQGYVELEDRAGQQRILSQMGTLLATKQDYAGALARYDQALALGGDPHVQRDLQARRALVVAERAAQQGEHKAAATSYLAASELLRQNGDTAQQAQALSSAAIAHQNLNDLDVASNLWWKARDIYKNRNDIEGQIKSQNGINSIEKQRRLAAAPRPTPVLVPFEEPCTVTSMTGYWLEVPKRRAQQQAPTFVWRFDVKSNSRAEDLLYVSRVDGTAKGDFVFGNEKFQGYLEWINGEGQKDVEIELPSEQQNCGRLNTNQSFYFVRTKYNPPATAY